MLHCLMEKVAPVHITHPTDSWAEENQRAVFILTATAGLARVASAVGPLCVKSSTGPIKRVHNVRNTTQRNSIMVSPSLYMQRENASDRRVAITVPYCWAIMMIDVTYLY